MNRMLRVESLSVDFGARRAVDGISFELAPGECVGVVGESGSGKSVTARALLGLAGPDARVGADALELDGRPLLGLSAAQWRRIRGERIGLVLQDALGSLDPLRPVGREVDDVLRLHTRLGRRERASRVRDALSRAGIADPDRRARQRSGELSGGLRQRALIAAAIALEAPYLVADEPTTALDASVGRQVLAELARLKDAGTGILLVSHDLDVVAGLADRVLVLAHGRVVESGPTARVLGRPWAPETRALLAAAPAGRPRGTRLSLPPGSDVPSHASTADAPTAAGAPTAPALVADRPTAPTPTSAPTSAPTIDAGTDRAPALELLGVGRVHATPDGPFTALADASIELRRGETLGIVGESGSGKTTLARIALGLEAPTSGRVLRFGEPGGSGPAELRRLGGRIGSVGQDTGAAFDPRWSVGRTVADALSDTAPRGRAARRRAIVELLGDVGLGTELLERSPAALSGGQRQRVAIARALAAEPELLVLDEPVSALDLTVQARVLDLLDELQRQRGLGYLFVSHDLAVIGHASDRVAVLQGGRIVETGPTARVLAAPEHPYTRRLLGADPPDGAGTARATPAVRPVAADAGAASDAEAPAAR